MESGEKDRKVEMRQEDQDRTSITDLCVHTIISMPSVELINFNLYSAMCIKMSTT